MNTPGLKDYQREALTWLETFLARCADGGDARAAYEATTREWRGLPLFYRELPGLPDVPYVCLRLPTGGGKTLVAAESIARANRSFLFTRHSLTLWLVPSETIREQTLRVLRTPGEMAREALREAFGDEVTILDIDGAKQMQPATLDGTNTVVVATFQAFKQEETGRLGAYRENGALQAHFAGITDPAIVGDYSLVDVLRMRRPFVIVDEAHNQGTPLAVDTLARFRPSAILELTATPDRQHQPSNVLFSVSAAALRAEDMIKLPLELSAHPAWQTVVGAAIACLNGLQTEADAERAATGEHLRPIMLVQAERKDATRETFTPERVKAILTGPEFNVPPEQVAIVTGATDELGAEDVLSETSRRRFIITVDKLREGWDCPFAYVLCSFRNSGSATAVEQILGRILRMPRARRKTREALNRSYAFATSAQFQSVAETLRDGLVASGFERQEAAELVHTGEALAGDGGEDLFTYAEAANRPVTFALAVGENGRQDLPDWPSLPAALLERVEIAPEAGTVTIRGSFTAGQGERLVASFRTEPGKAAARQALATLRTPPPRTREPSPAERGELFTVPLLSYRQEDWVEEEAEEFDDSHLLAADWRLLDFPAALGEGEFPRQEETLRRARLTISELERVRLEHVEGVEAQMALFDHRGGATAAGLVWWLSRNLPEETVSAEDKAAWLLAAVDHLTGARGWTLDELDYRKFRLRATLAVRLKAAKQAAMRGNHQTLLGREEAFQVDDRCQVVFTAGRYPYNWRYNGFTELRRHFFPEIGDLKAEGEEFRCAEFLANQLAGVRYWVRNLSAKPGMFSLQTATDRFYPDFVCRMEDGRALAVEYKNTRDYDLPENEEKRVLGDLWERRSGGDALFIMPRGEDWAAIRGKVRGE